MTIEKVGFANPNPTQNVGQVCYATRRNQEEPIKTGVNFEGRRDADTFEKKESNTAKNIAIGTAVGAAALAVTAAFFGKYGIKFKNPGNWFTKGTNAVIENCHKGASLIKKYLYTEPLNYIKKLIGKGGNGGTPSAAGGGTPPAGSTGGPSIPFN